MTKPQEAPYRELTFAAVALGIVQGIILNCAFCYAALKLGFSIGGSTVAAIMGYALLRGVLGKGTIIENNINQTIASGMNPSGGVVFTLPALFMLDWKLRQNGGDGINFQMAPILMASVAAAVLGVVFIIPLRKQMIDIDRLRFPTGVAVATILRSGSAGFDKFKLLIFGIVLSALVKLAFVLGWSVPGLIEHEELNFGFGLLPAYVTPLIALSLMNVGAGLLAGRGGLAFVVGGLVAWWVIAPVAVNMGWVPSLTDAGEVVNQADYVYGEMLRPLGIGVLIGGALMGVIVSFPAIKAAIKSLADARKSTGDSVASDEMPIQVLVGGIVGAVALFFSASLMTEGVSVGQAILASVVATLWVGLAALIVSQATGMTDISPLSGMALISVTLMMFLLNKNVAASMIVGIAVCIAIGQAADMMQDLKTGFMIGGRPVKQQLAQFAITWLGPLISIGVVYVLWRGPDGTGGGFGVPGSSLPAPQAGALMAIIESVQSGEIPVDKYTLGGLVGLILGAAPMAGLGVLIGLAMYLPLSITLGYGVGCVISIVLQKRKGTQYIENKVVPFAAGLIVGEALMGVADALFKVLAGFI